MLELLHIENIAIIQEADISFEGGFNALTGETGAGKSIVIDALSAVLGQRTSRELIRTGADKAFVSATFSGVDSALAEELGIAPEADGTLLLQREIHSDGKNVCPRQRAACHGESVESTGRTAAEYPRAARRTGAVGRGAAFGIPGQLWKNGKPFSCI